MKLQQRGITIVELMVSIAIGLVLITVASSVYVSSTRSYRGVDESGRIDEAGRLAIKIVSSNLQLAGFRLLDGPRPQVALPPVPLDVPVRGCRYGFENPSANDWTCKAAGNASDSDAVWILADTDAFASGTGKGADCLGNAVASGVVRQAWNHFYIQTDTFSSGGQTRTVSQLMCAGRNPNNPAAATIPQPLLSGVEQMTLAYGIAPVGSEVPSQFVNADALLSDADWQQVVAIRICILMKTDSPGLASDSTAVVTDCRGAPVANTNQSVYKTLTSTVALRNRIFSSI